MSGMPMFSWMFRDPAECVDRRRFMERRIAEAEAERLDRERRRKARKIRKLVRLAKAGKLRGQKR